MRSIKKHGKAKHRTSCCNRYNLYSIPYIRNFSRRVNLAKMTLGRCVKFSPSLMFSLFQGFSMKTYSRVYFLLCLFFRDFKEVANSAKIKPTRKNPDIRYIPLNIEISHHSTMYVILMLCWHHGLVMNTFFNIQNVWAYLHKKPCC